MNVLQPCRLAGPTHDESSFMLLEVLLALALLSISLFGLIERLSLCVDAARSVQNYSTSVILLANQSYVFHTERGADILNQDGGFDDYPGYTWSRTLEQTESEGLWKQVLTVSWRERGQIASDSVVEYKYMPDKQR